MYFVRTLGHVVIDKNYLYQADCEFHDASLQPRRLESLLCNAIESSWI